MSTNLSTEGQTTTVQQDDAGLPTPGFGWTQYAEKINGRFAMIGFVALVMTEWVTRQDFFTWIGLR
ncbi:MAG: chlorophyll a/b-binding protein [Phormidesmis sp.]